MPLKRYPEWKELDFELEDKGKPLVIRVDEEPEECSEEMSQPVGTIQKKNPEPVGQVEEVQVVSPLLFCQKSIHQEIKELQKSVPDYKEFREKKKPEQYHEETKEEREINEISAGVAVAMFGFVLPAFIIIFLLYDVPGLIRTENAIRIGRLYLGLYLGLALFSFLFNFFRKHPPKRTQEFALAIIDSFCFSGIVSTLLWLTLPVFKSLLSFLESYFLFG